MSTGYSDSDSLTRDIRLLDNAVDELRDDLRRLDDRVDTELSDLRTDHDSQLTAISDELADTTVTAGSAANAVQKLADRVEWLSRYIRLGHGAAETDLDSVGADTARDLTTAAAGRQAASTLLSTDRRRALQATIDAAQNTRTRWQQSADTLLAHSRDLAATPTDARRATGLRHAALRYRAAVTAHQSTTSALDTTTRAADRAHQVFTDDDHRHASLQPAITAGESADTRARTQLRTRIADTLSGEAPTRVVRHHPRLPTRRRHRRRRLDEPGHRRAGLPHHLRHHQPHRRPRPRPHQPPRPGSRACPLVPADAPPPHSLTPTTGAHGRHQPGHRHPPPAPASIPGRAPARLRCGRPRCGVPRLREQITHPHAAGKNGADIRMTVDAMETPFNPPFSHPDIDVFILVTGDSDYSALVHRLREYGKHVVGVGTQANASQRLVSVCSEYKYWGTIAAAVEPTAQPAAPAAFDIADAEALLLRAMQQLPIDTPAASAVKNKMLALDPAFDEANYGCRSFRDFLSRMAHRVSPAGHSGADITISLGQP